VVQTYQTHRTRLGWIGLRYLLTPALVLALTVVLAAAAGAQSRGRSPSVAAEQVACVPIGGNAVAWAKVENNLPDTSVRLFFRRLHDVVEDFYWVDMYPDGAGRYWGVFPKAEDHPLARHELLRDREAATTAPDREDQASRWAAWWRAKDRSDDRDPNQDLDQALIRERATLGKRFERDWLAKLDDADFEAWLERQINEPTEYFAAVVDSQGRALAQSKVLAAEVKSPDDCDPVFTPQQAGEKENLTVGETGGWQRDKPVFHWLCDGVVTRYDPFFIKRPDDVCRACVIAWWHKKEFLVPLVTVPPAVIITQFNNDPVSPSRP